MANADFLNGFVDKTGRMVVPYQYKDVRGFSDGLAAVANADLLYGYLDKTGKEVIPCQYQAVEAFSGGVAAVENADHLWGVIDQTGKTVVSCRYKTVGPFREGAAFATDGSGKTTILKVDDQPSAPGFTDVKDTDYFAAPVKWAVEKGITTGTSKTTFSPNNTCTTADILTFLWRANGAPAPTGSSVAVPTGKYYTEAANWALEKGLTDTFQADAPATRAATVTYLWNLAGKPAADAPAFTDVDKDAAYAPAVAWAVKEGITTGTSATTFAPDNTCTRGQIVTFLYRDLA